MASVVLSSPELFNSNIFRDTFVSNRPPLKSRNFTSEAVESAIKSFHAGVKNKELAWLFENCFPNTLDTTVDFEMIDGNPIHTLSLAILMPCGSEIVQLRYGLILP